MKRYLSFIFIVILILGMTGTIAAFWFTVNTPTTNTTNETITVGIANPINTVINLDDELSNDRLVPLGMLPYAQPSTNPSEYAVVDEVIMTFNVVWEEDDLTTTHISDGLMLVYLDRNTISLPTAVHHLVNIELEMVHQVNLGVPIDVSIRITLLEEINWDQYLLIANQSWRFALAISIIEETPAEYFLVTGNTITGLSTLRPASLTQIVVPRQINGITITTIGANGLRWGLLTSIILQNTITDLGTNALANNNLTQVVLSNSLTELVMGVLGANYLTSIVLPNGLTAVDGLGNNSLTSLVLPTSIINLGNTTHVISNNQLTSIVVPYGVLRLSASVFNLNNLTAVRLPASLTQIDGNAFNSNPNLQEIHFAGTILQWQSMTRAFNWRGNAPIVRVIAVNGVLNI